MASIEKRGSPVRPQKMLSRPKPQPNVPETDELEFLLFQPKDRPKSLKITRQYSLKTPSPNISLGLPQKQIERSSIMELSGNQTPVIFYVEDQQDRRTRESRPKSRLDGISARSSQKDSPKPVAVKNMPTTLPSIKFPKIENQPLPPYYIPELIKALEDETNSRKLTPYREQFEQLCQAVSLYSSSQSKPSGKIVLPKADCLKKTVILDLDETLIHCTDAFDSANSMQIPSRDGTKNHHKIHVRPYCREFLFELSQIAQVIIFTAGNSRYADAVLDQLDPQNKLISYRLYREHCSYQKNHYVKDIREINRKMSDMIIVDNSPFSYALNIDNAVPILPFYGTSKDVELKALLSYLQEVVKVKDVRHSNRFHFKLNQYVQDYLTITNSKQ